MTKSKFTVLVSLLLTVVSALRAVPTHDLYLCTTISTNFVVGAKLATPSGIFRRDAEGAFQHIGINFPFMLNIAFDPRDPKVCYAVAINGILISADGGTTWRIGNSWDMTEPKDVSIDPNAPDHIYVALPDGIAVSTDRGATWPRRENGLPARGKYTQTIEVDRTQAGRVFAGCESGVYLTENGARSWRRVLPATATVTDIQQSPYDSKLWIATTQNEGVQLSRDGGLTWRKITALPSAEPYYNVAFDPANARRWAVSSWSYGIYVTEDGGVTWSERNAGLPEERAIFRVGIDPDSGRLYTSTYRGSMYVSDDSGRAWKKAGLEGSTIYNFVFVPRSTK